MADPKQQKQQETRSFARRRSAVTGRRAGRATRRPAPPAREKVGPFGRGGFGCAEGKIWIAPNFDDPLEEFDASS